MQNKPLHSTLAFVRTEDTWSAPLGEDFSQRAQFWDKVARERGDSQLTLLIMKDGKIVVSRDPLCVDIPYGLSPMYENFSSFGDKWNDFWSDNSLIDLLSTAYRTQNKLTAGDFLLAYASINLMNKGKIRYSYAATVRKLVLLSTYLMTDGKELPEDVQGYSATRLVASYLTNDALDKRISPLIVERSRNNLTEIITHMHDDATLQDGSGYKIIAPGNSFLLASGDLASLMEASHV
jgi:hypothetical protein